MLQCVDLLLLNMTPVKEIIEQKTEISVMKKKDVFLGVAISLVWVGSFSCGSKHLSAEMIAEGEQMVVEATELSCRLAQLEEKTKELWDQVVTSLDKNLPADMPEMERKNMLAVRNTDLIQMFEDYDDLDTMIHHLVQDAGMEDAKNAAEVLDAKRKLESLEIEFGHFLQKIDKNDTTTIQEWRVKFEKAHHDGCK